MFFCRFINNPPYSLNFPGIVPSLIMFQQKTVKERMCKSLFIYPIMGRDNKSYLMPTLCCLGFVWDNFIKILANFQLWGISF